MKSSTLKSPSKESMIGVAIAVKTIEIVRINGAAQAEPPDNLDSQCLGTMYSRSFSSCNRFRFCNQVSMSKRIRGAHNPVRMNAEATPSAASSPKERRAGMLDVKLAAKAAMVVKEVNMMARPTLERLICTASSVVLPLPRSSL